MGCLGLAVEKTAAPGQVLHNAALLAVSSIDPAQYLPVNVKGAERYHAGQQHFPGSGPELPLLLYAHAQGVENEQQEQGAVQRPQHLYKGRIAQHVLQRHGNKYKRQQGNAFQQTDDP